MGVSLLLIPVFLFGIDVSTLVITATANRRLCYQAARAASYQDDAVHAKQAAQRMIDGSPRSSIINDIAIDNLQYPSNGDQAGEVEVRTKMKVKVPVPFPYFSETSMVADAHVYVTNRPADL
jgi:hypothetical protein